MNLTQQKLTKSEWDYLELPVNKKELYILKFIHDSYNNLNASENPNNSLIRFLKINVEDYEDFHKYFYNKFYETTIHKLVKENNLNYKLKINIKKLNIKKANKIRIRNVNNSEIIKDPSIFENLLMEQLMLYFTTKSKTKKCYYYYSLLQLSKKKVKHVNYLLLNFINYVLNAFKNEIKVSNLIKHSHKYIEENKLLSQYNDVTLFSHQKQIFSLVKNNNEPKLVLYQAPTGTGKTMTPVGLVNNKTVIFTCAAKHVGLQLAKSCIALGIPIAIAFGCETPDDIRLHYYAVTDFVRNRRSGGIFRVDNTNGEKVKIIITDIQSYLPAMNYMLAFNKKEDILWYWDEPTITLDYNEHSFHTIMQKNWVQNEIPNIVLSSATLPSSVEIYPMVSSFRQRFKGEQYNIVSYDCNKSIQLLNTNGNIVVLHNEFKDYRKFKKSVKFVTKNKTLLRYIDVKQVSKFIMYILENIEIDDRYQPNEYFQNIEDITIHSIKLYYLKLCRQLKQHHFEQYRKNKTKETINSVIKLTTSDAKTLTDGPTIFMTNDVEKIGMFYLKASNIPENVLTNLLNIIDTNEEFRNALNLLIKEEKERTDKISDKVLDSARANDKEVKIQNEFNKKVSAFMKKMKTIELSPSYIPNREEHYKLWNPNKEVPSNLFTSNIDESIVEEIVSLDINKEWKILLLMGIGVFSSRSDVKYIDIMKKLAEKQKLFVIIASSDYIYGTNYQFCHGYLSKDLQNMTQEKLIQALGRVGRKNIQKSYSIRLRNNNIVEKLFMEEENKIEVRNMNRLFA
jgi:hypothetical protein|tara:strand:+ start:5809 stop:8184 length:2376 start_codon:yes stop_codon:yes gene_type:complete